MSDPGYRTDIDWDVYQVCGYDHNIVRRDEYTRHHLTNHDGLAAERDTHATVCKIASEHAGRQKCICRIEEYEVLAALMTAEKERDIAVKKATFWKTAGAVLRQRTVDLYDRYDNRAAETSEQVFNSILDTEEDPNPSVADDERDRWLIERTWLSALSAVLDFMPTED